MARRAGTGPAGPTGAARVVVAAPAPRASGCAEATADVVAVTGAACLLASPPASVALQYGAGAVVVLTGPPGAGKSTFLRRVAWPAGAVVLDPYELTRPLAAPVRTLAHRALRPAAHAVHWALAVRAVWFKDGPVVVHAHGARPLLRRVLHRLARARGRPSHLLVLDATVAEAVAGQRARRRTVPAGRFARHWAHHQHLLASLARVDGHDGHDSVVVLSRAAARRVAAVRA